MWGWGAGWQETAEFKILESFFVAAYGFRKRIRDIEAPYWTPKPTGWRLSFIDGTTAEVMP